MDSPSHPAGCRHQTRLHLGAASAAAGYRGAGCRRSVAPSLARRWESGYQRGVDHRGAGSFTETTQPAAGGAAEAAGRREPVQGQREGPGQAGEACPTHEGLQRGVRAGSSSEYFNLNEHFSKD